MEMALLDLCQMEPLLPLGDLLERLDLLERRLARAGASGGPVGGSGGGREAVLALRGPLAVRCRDVPGPRTRPPGDVSLGFRGRCSWHARR